MREDQAGQLASVRAFADRKPSADFSALGVAAVSKAVVIAGITMVANIAAVHISPRR
jgi:hypothetical protein